MQTSARNMNLEYLKKEYGKYVCFMGGVDVQNMMAFGKPKEIVNYIEGIKKMFDLNGGIILGPAHVITADIPIENILAIYRPDLIR